MAKRRPKFEVDESKLLGLISYFPILFVVPLIMKHRDKFAIYHAKQGIGLFVMFVSAFVISRSPVFGDYFGWILWMLSFIFFLVGILHVLQDEKVPLPLIGRYFERIDL